MVRVPFFLLCLLLLHGTTGCTLLEQIKANLPPVEKVPEEPVESSTQPLPAPLVTPPEPETTAALTFNHRLAGLSPEWRKKEIQQLNTALAQTDTVVNRLKLVLLHLAPAQVDIVQARALLQPLVDDPRGQSDALRGLVGLLKQSLDMQARASHDLDIQRRKNVTLTQKLNQEQQRSNEMAQKLQKLIDIEKIIDQRQKQKN